MDQKNRNNAILKAEKEQNDKEIKNDLLESRRKFICAISPALLAIHAGFFSFVYYYCQNADHQMLYKLIYAISAFGWGFIDYKIFRYIWFSAKEK